MEQSLLPAPFLSHCGFAVTLSLTLPFSHLWLLRELRGIRSILIVGAVGVINLGFLRVVLVVLIFILHFLFHFVLLI